MYLELQTEQVESLFPAYIQVDLDGVIISCGPSLHRHLKDNPCGHKLLEIFAIERPVEIKTFADLSQEGGAIILSCLSNQKLRLRGAVFAQSHYYGLLLNHAPNVMSGEMEAELSYFFSDFAPHDNLQDLLMSVRLREGILADTERLIKELKTEKGLAESVNFAKSQFLSTISHEIRTPMNGVLGMAEVLFQTELTVKQELAAKTIYNSGQALLNIINDLLDYSKIEADQKKLDLYPFNLKGLMDEVGDFLGNSACEKNIDLCIFYPNSIPTHFIGDKGAVRQILINLIGNAIKFTEKGNISVRVECDILDDCGQLEISIQDTGVGISQDKFDTIFTSFEQADNTITRKFGGPGLGLAISRSLTDMMQGKLDVSSVVGEGSEFTLNLPLPIAADMQDKVETDYDFGKQVALIVDDIEINRVLYSEYVKALNFTPITVSCARHARTVLLRTKEHNIEIPLLLTDYDMPDEDGFSLIQSLRRSPEYADMKTIIMSSTNDISVLQKFIEIGVKAYLSKPVRFEKFRETILNQFNDDDFTIKAPLQKNI